jgi:hypothetical protein
MSPELRARLHEWLRSGDPVERAHAAWRLNQSDTLMPGRAPSMGGQGWAPDSPLIPLTESLELLRLVKLCRYRSTTGCGCSGARCGLRSAIVSHRDCLDCVRSYGAA